jgi:D-alanine-D-alanine ligase
MRIGILYNLVDKVESGKEIDKLADNEVLQTASAVKEALEKKGHAASLVRLNGRLEGLKKRFDFIFNLAEGIGGNHLAEPEIALSLKKAGIPFSGADDYALALCMDKARTKKLLQKHEIPTPEFQVFKNPDDKLKKKLGFPLIVKPAYEDGSIGIELDSVVRNDDELRHKVKEVLSTYNQPALVERFIDGREINVAIIGNRKNLYVLPLSEIMFDFPDNLPKIVSFKAKWVEDSMQYKGTVGKCPAEVPKHLHDKLAEAAKKAFKVTKCKDYARVDFRVKGDEIYALEVNPNPCINPNGAGFVRSAKAAGYAYDDMINKILELATSRKKAE